MAYGPFGQNQTIACIRKQGVLYNTYTTAKSLLTSATAVVGVSDQIPIIAPPAFYDGHKFRIRFQAGFSNIVTTPGTMNFQVVLGGVAVYDSGAIIITTTAHTLTPLWGEIDLTLDTSGNGTLARFRGMGRFNCLAFQNSGTAAADVTTGGIPTILNNGNTAPALGTGFNAAQANALDFFAGFSISNAGNGIQLWEYEVIDCN